jgi:hypothetical protein
LLKTAQILYRTVVLLFCATAGDPKAATKSSVPTTSTIYTVSRRDGRRRLNLYSSIPKSIPVINHRRRIDTHQNSANKLRHSRGADSQHRAPPAARVQTSKAVREYLFRMLVQNADTESDTQNRTHDGHTEIMQYGNMLRTRHQHAVNLNTTKFAQQLNGH